MLLDDTSSCQSRSRCGLENVGSLDSERTVRPGPSAQLAPRATTDVQLTLGRAAQLLPSTKRCSAAERCRSQLSRRVATRGAHKAEALTSFIETVFQLVVRAHVRASAIQPVVLVELPVVQLVVELAGGGVERVPAVIVLVAVVVVQDGGLADGHPDDGAAMLVRTAGAAVAIAALRPQQDGGDVVDLVGGLRAGALLGDTATLAPPVAGVQDEREEEDQEEERDQASLEEAATERSELEKPGGAQGQRLFSNRTVNLSQGT